MFQVKEYSLPGDVTFAGPQCKCAEYRRGRNRMGRGTNCMAGECQLLPPL
jgi:hypothetical protein